jgi:hypothetical protein
MSVLVQTLSLYNAGTDHAENTASNSSSIVAFVYLLLQSREMVAMEMCLQSHLLEMDVSFGSAVLTISRHVTVWRWKKQKQELPPILCKNCHL